jgi:hypothetical protein
VAANEIFDDDGLLRRIPPLHTAVTYQDDAMGVTRIRPPSDAYSLEIDEEGLSFHLESSLRAAGEQLTYGCPEGIPGWGVARISVGRLRELGLTLTRDHLPHHVQVLGLRTLSSNARRRKQREIAKSSEYVVLPRAS